MDQKRLNEIIRVDHAGEHGAIAIYKGQIKTLELIGDKKTLPLIYGMLEGEKAHAQKFDELVEKKKTKFKTISKIDKKGKFFFILFFKPDIVFSIFLYYLHRSEYLELLI